MHFAGGDRCCEALAWADRSRFPRRFAAQGYRPCPASSNTADSRLDSLTTSQPPGGLALRDRGTLGNRNAAVAVRSPHFPGDRAGFLARAELHECPRCRGRGVHGRGRRSRIPCARAIPAAMSATRAKSKPCPKLVRAPSEQGASRRARRPSATIDRQPSIRPVASSLAASKECQTWVPIAGVNLPQERAETTVQTCQTHALRARTSQNQNRQPPRKQRPLQEGQGRMIPAARFRCKPD